MKNKPLILVVNDDGMGSTGISVLSSIVREIGDVYVVAPDTNRSGLSHAMTLHEDICVEHVNVKKNEFICSGTPVDCVKLAVNQILPRLPDLCVSGINHGSNHSINGLYSGTLHAAMESTIQGVPSIAFSHLSYLESTSLNPFRNIIKDICLKTLRYNLPDGITLNVNFPDVHFDEIQGLKLCVQSKGSWKENFKLVNSDNLMKRYSISGQFHSDKTDLKSDSWALANNFISIVPVSVYYGAYLVNELKYLDYDF